MYHTEEIFFAKVPVKKRGPSNAITFKSNQPCFLGRKIGLDVINHHFFVKFSN